MTATLLGERLSELRAHLAAEEFDPNAGSRARVAREAGLSPGALARLEKAGTGTAAALAALLSFYQDQGFNLAWVLASAHAGVPLRAFRDIFQDSALTEARDPLLRLNRLLQPAAAAPAAGQAPPHDALHALLRQVQDGIHQALAHLLPPIRLVESAADLREYQRLLPPVRAGVAGWRSRAWHLAPYHYYEAGESIPRCGSPAYYLTYDPGLAPVSDTIKCLTCRAHVGEAPPAFAQPAPAHRC